MLKNIILLLMAFVVLPSSGANLLKDDTWQINRPGQFAKLADGSFQISSPDNKSNLIIRQRIILDHKSIRPIFFGASFKTLSMEFDRPHSDYSVYMNLIHQSGKVTGCVVVAPDPRKKNQWQNLKRTYIPKEPVKAVDFIICLIKRPGKALVKDIFMEIPKEVTSKGTKSLGVGVFSSELRHFAASLDEKKRPFVLAAPLDMGKRNYLLFTELDTGKTTQHFLPVDGGHINGAVLTPSGKYVCGLAGEAVIFDINTKQAVKGKSRAPGITWSAALGNDGTVYLGNTPSTLFAVDPNTAEVKNLGRMDPKETQLYWIAVDRENWIYCGVGVARAGVVAFNPRTGEKRQLIPEKDRVLGSGRVDRDIMGNVKITSPSGFAALCCGGEIIGDAFIENAVVPHLKYGLSISRIDNTRYVVNYNMNSRTITFKDRNELKKYSFDYLSGGVNLTSLAAGPDGKIYVSSAHPHHLCAVDPASGKKHDLGYNPIVGGGNFCNMTAANGKLYACEYAGGRMWEYDPSLPVHFPNNFFGIPAETLVSTGKVVNGQCSFPAKDILLCRAEKDDALFRFSAPVPQPGKYFLNLRFYRYPTYGTVTVKAGNKSLSLDLCGKSGRTEFVTLGPFDLSGKEFFADFTVKKSPQGKYPWFSLTGFELSTVPRKENKVTGNPKILGQWQQEIMRPRTISVSPDGKEVFMGGFSYDGMEGGQIALHNTVTGKNRLISHWLPGESCIASVYLDDHTIIGTTSIDAIGGHRTVKDACVFVMDTRSGKVLKTCRIDGAEYIQSCALWQGKILVAASNHLLYILDPATLKIEKQFPTGYTVRNALQKTPDNRMFLLENTRISEIDPVTFRPEPVAKPARGSISGGGAVSGGKLFFIVDRIEIWEYLIPQKK